MYPLWSFAFPHPCRRIHLSTPNPNITKMLPPRFAYWHYLPKAPTPHTLPPFPSLPTPQLWTLLKMKPFPKKKLALIKALIDYLTKHQHELSKEELVPSEALPSALVIPLRNPPSFCILSQSKSLDVALSQNLLSIYNFQGLQMGIQMEARYIGGKNVASEIIAMSTLLLDQDIWAMGRMEEWRDWKLDMQPVNHKGNDGEVRDLNQTPSYREMTVMLLNIRGARK